MGLLVLSVILSIVLGCVLWLIVGDRIPPGDTDKLPPIINIVSYSVLLVLPVYLLIFFIF